MPREFPALESNQFWAVESFVGKGMVPRDKQVGMREHDMEVDEMYTEHDSADDFCLDLDDCGDFFQCKFERHVSGRVACYRVREDDPFPFILYCIRAYWPNCRILSRGQKKSGASRSSPGFVFHMQHVRL